jgi:hypothetical protein
MTSSVLSAPSPFSTSHATGQPRLCRDSSLYRHGGGGVKRYCPVCLGGTAHQLREIPNLWPHRPVCLRQWQLSAGERELLKAIVAGGERWGITPKEAGSLLARAAQRRR